MLELIDTELKIRNQALGYVLENLQSYMYTVSIVVSETIKKNNNIFFFGNGRSINNIENFIYNLKKIDRDIKITSLCESNIEITSIADEFGYDRIYDKQIEYRAKKDDLLIGFSAVGNNKNVLRALSLGRNIECRTIGFSGNDGGVMDEFCDINLVVPSEDENCIMEMQMIMINIISQNIEKIIG